MGCVGAGLIIAKISQVKQKMLPVFSFYLFPDLIIIGAVSFNIPDEPTVNVALIERGKYVVNGKRTVGGASRHVPWGGISISI